MADVTMPQLGETVTEGTITRWFKQVGDDVAMDEILFEISTDKVDSEVPSPVAGVLNEILAQEGDVVEVGQVLARVGDAGEAPTPPPAAEPPVAEVPVVEAPVVEAPVAETPVVEAPVVEQAPPPPPPPPPPAPAPPAPAPAAAAPAADASMVLSPVVRRLINDNNLDPSTITGSGIGGRITAPTSRK
jgi:pyruvate dehydrogenase E2 component (dihydrolipoamide acetyltransferase)